MTSEDFYRNRWMAQTQLTLETACKAHELSVALSEVSHMLTESVGRSLFEMTKQVPTGAWQEPDPETKENMNRMVDLIAPLSTMVDEAREQFSDVIGGQD